MSNIDAITQKLKDAPADMVREVLDFIEALEAKRRSQAAAPGRSWDDILQALPGTSGFKGDPVQIQRQLRAEWDRE
jgi:Protein of unknown function (DUF2281)